MMSRCPFACHVWLALACLTKCQLQVAAASLRKVEMLTGRLRHTRTAVA